ncbi:MAG: SMP-30/gluconolactonase/LRE family protein, partial [Gammaproteobacteria bacterium]|nr:SMP-30/gluconolactonase/LRE family protein [Gammaproteobacteria bacterium]
MKRLTVLMMIILLPLLSACVELTPERSVSIAATVAFTEGPTVAEDGTVYFTDLYSSRIMRLSTTGTVSVFRQPSYRANGLLFDSEWRLLACEGGDGD